MALFHCHEGVDMRIAHSFITQRNRLLATALMLGLICQIVQTQVPQEVRWLRVGSLRSWYSNYGCEMEIGRTGSATEQNDGLMWPAEFPWQNNEAGKAMWIGTTNYFDRTLNQVVPHKVVAVGPRTADPVSEMMPVSFKMYGRYSAPSVVVDGQTATDNYLNDEVDEVRDTLKADRMIVNELNTYIGLTVRRRLLAFSQQNHDNYFIYEYVLKNTGIVDNKGTVENTTLTGVVLFFQYRYAFGNEAFRRGWYPSNNIDWGRNTVNQVIGTNPTAPGFEFRAQYSWYGRHSQSPVSDDLGLPYVQGDGHLAAVHYVGTVTLHADKSAVDHSDDPYQPTSTMYVGNDTGPQTNNQYDPVQMTRKYLAMTAGHAAVTHADAVGNGYADKWGADAGGYAQGKGFGPYTLAPGDSVRIVLAEAVAGLSRRQAFDIGATWLNNQPPFTLPNGTTTSDRDVYKDAWVETGIDSLKQTFRRAMANFNSGYSIPQAPPAPGVFTVTSGGDRIRLEWSSVSWPNLAGYDIYRAEGQADTFYTKVHSVGNNEPTSWDDTSPKRGVNYYYYVVSRDDGSTNGGVPLISSKFLTMTSNSSPAFLRRPAQTTTLDNIRVVPNPYNRAAALANMYFGRMSPDRIAFYGLPPECTIKIYTERGDLISTLVHNDGSGDQLWDQRTSSGQIIVSGLYIAAIETPDGQSIIRKFIIVR
jgi:hypothetical protein